MSSLVQSKAAAAFMAFFKAQFASQPAFAPVAWVEAGKADDAPLPFISVGVDNCREYRRGNYTALFKVQLQTSLSDEQLDLHTDRYSAILGLLTNERAVLAALNKPKTGDDEREVKQFELLGYTREAPLNDEASFSFSQALVNDISVGIAFRPFDPTAA